MDGGSKDIMRKIVAALALTFMAFAATAQTDKQTQWQEFCNIVGEYSAAAVIDQYKHVPLEQSLRRTDGYVCTDSLPQACQIRVATIQKMMRYWYAFAVERGYATLQPNTLATLDSALQTNATSACWQAARQH